MTSKEIWRRRRERWAKWKKEQALLKETPNQFVSRVLKDAKEHKKQEEINIGNWNFECLRQMSRNPYTRRNSSRT